MIYSLKQFVWKFLNFIKLGGIVQLVLYSALLEDGWFKSFHSKRSIDKNGEPIPWYAYAFTKFLENRLGKEMVVFEYGAGNSTLWFSKRVGKIYSVEHDKRWYNALLSQVPENVTLLCKQNDNSFEYSHAVKNIDSLFDICIIDGMERIEATKAAIGKLKDDGVIIFDNSQLEEYESAFRLLKENGFKRLDFTSMLPIVSYNNTTSVFYRTNNCLSI